MKKELNKNEDIISKITSYLSLAGKGCDTDRRAMNIIFSFPYYQRNFQTKNMNQDRIEIGQGTQ